jgi:AraC-like DNA-binding protein
LVGYREHPAPAALTPWLQCTWEHQADGARPAKRVLPDGCIDVIWSRAAGTEIVGANTTAFLVPLAVSACVVGARLRPGAAPALLGVAAEAVRDVSLPIGEVLGSEGERLAMSLDEHPDPVLALEQALLARATRSERPDPLVRAAVIGLERPGVAVSRLAGELGVSERQLRRRVCGAVGYGPKRLVRVLRLERALAAARAGGDLARVALDAGYADQAHFCGDCRELAGVSPSVVLST